MRDTSSSTSTPRPFELGVVGVDVLAGQRDARLDARRVARARLDERDRRVGARRGDLDPAVAVAEGDVHALLEAELLGVEGERARPGL